MTDSRFSDQYLADALEEALIVLHSNNQIEWCNQAAMNLFSSELEPIQGRDILNVVPHADLELLIEKKIDGPIDVVSPSDKRSRFSITARPYSQGKKLLIIKNITHTFYLEAMRQDFVANLSHELRTPLTVFHGYLDLLISSPGVEPDKLQEILQQMSGQADRMERLVEDLLLLSKLESVEPDISTHAPINVNALLKEIIADAKLLSDGQHRFIVDIDDTASLMANAGEMHSAFSNLIYNAVRYTPEQGTIHVSWFKKAGEMVFAVKDDGIGISLKHVSRITQRFYRVDKSRLYRGQGGTGLGLAIVKHVALRHGAELKIDSKLGSGSLFQLVFSV